MKKILIGYNHKMWECTPSVIENGFLRVGQSYKLGCSKDGILVFDGLIEREADLFLWREYDTNTDFPGKEMPSVPEPEKAQDKAMRFNTGKPQLSFVLQGIKSVTGLAQVLEFGAQKYERANWLRGLDPLEIQDSLLRHLTAYTNGEVFDSDSGLPHIDHIHFNAKALAEFGVRTDVEQA